MYATTTMTYAAPTVSTVTPVTTYAAPAVVEEVVVQQPSMRVSRGINGPNNLLAAGQVISERVISIQELQAQNRYFEEEERAAVTKTRAIEVMAQPVMVQQATPVTTYAAPAAPMVVQSSVMAPTVSVGPVVRATRSIVSPMTTTLIG